METVEAVREKVGLVWGMVVVATAVAEERVVKRAETAVVEAQGRARFPARNA